MAKSKTSKLKADIDFENELWNAAIELRGAVVENQDRYYVLSLDRFLYKLKDKLLLYITFK